MAKATPSPNAARKAATGNSDDGLPMHHFAGLLAHLATLTRNTVRLRAQAHTFAHASLPTTVQHRAFELLGVPIPTRTSLVDRN